MSKGTYLLLLELERSQSVEVGALGEMRFSQGSYSYVGSAMNGLEARVARHLRPNKKRRWHIDYLLERAGVYGVVLVPDERRLECALAAALGQTLPCIRHFGSSDCHCPGHLFFASARSDLEEAVTLVLAELSPSVWQHLSQSGGLFRNSTQLSGRQPSAFANVDHSTYNRRRRTWNRTGSNCAVTLI